MNTFDKNTFDDAPFDADFDSPESQRYDSARVNAWDAAL